jgi:hypothetical protein
MMSRGFDALSHARFNAYPAEGSRRETVFKILLVPPKIPPQPSKLPSAKKAVLPRSRHLLSRRP